ncbi:MAG: hypothetical protein METHP_01850 [Methanoregula sp. SKADARSKE-2]|nr:MAG: hypothetical protein METHP_01850 [Methanoregula sp. SKADARSKE-2]
MAIEDGRINCYRLFSVGVWFNTFSLLIDRVAELFLFSLLREFEIEIVLSDRSFADFAHTKSQVLCSDCSASLAKLFVFAF